MSDHIALSLGLGPADVANLPPEALPGLLVELGALEGAEAARLVPPPDPQRNGERAEAAAPRGHADA